MVVFAVVGERSGREDEAVRAAMMLLQHNAITRAARSDDQDRKRTWHSLSLQGKVKCVDGEGPQIPRTLP